MTVCNALVPNRGVVHASNIDPRTPAPRGSAPTPPSAPPTHAIAPLHRRGLMLGSAAAALVATLPTPAHAALPAQVGSYLPTAGMPRPTMDGMLPTRSTKTGVEDFVLFVPDARKTPALRAGTVDPTDPYRFAMPPTWREGKVANIQSGSYCQVHTAK